MNIYLRKILKNFIETDNTLAWSRRNQLPPHRRLFQESSSEEVWMDRTVGEVPADVTVQSEGRQRADRPRARLC